MTALSGGRLLPDARYFQIAALTTLLAVNFALIDFGARPVPSALAVATALLTQSHVAASAACRSISSRR